MRIKHAMKTQIQIPVTPQLLKNAKTANLAPEEYVLTLIRREKARIDKKSSTRTLPDDYHEKQQEQRRKDREEEIAALRSVFKRREQRMQPHHA